MVINKKIKTLLRAFPVTVPVLLGYLFIGLAFGVLLEQAGYSFVWAILMSVLIYAGSMQFVAINFLLGGFSFVSIALMTLMINSRHIFYGISMLDRFAGMSKAKKWYMIFSLTDETYALLCSQRVPDGLDKSNFLFYIALLNQIYWVIGSALGAVASSLINFDSSGIDFAMTALFVVILVEQLRTTTQYWIAIIGAGSALVCLLLFGTSAFVLPAMVIIIVFLVVFRTPIKTKIKEDKP